MKNRISNIIKTHILKWCVYAVVFAAPFSKSISEIAISIGIAVWIFKKISDRDFKLAETSLNIPFLVLMLTIMPSLFNSAYPALSTKAFFTKVLKYAVFYFVMIDSINSKENLKDLFMVAFLSVVVIAIDGFVQYYYAWSDGLHNYPSFKFRFEYEGGFSRGFPTACFPFPNDFAAWILLTLFPLASVALFDLKGMFLRYLIGITTISLFYLFTLAKARGAWVGLIVSALCMVLTKGKIWVIFLVIAIFIMPFVLKMEMAQYIFDIGSFTDRGNMWRTGWVIFKQHPVVGNGLNTFFENFKKHRSDEWKDKRGSYAHNCYLQMACDTGLIGLGGFLWLMYSYFMSVINALRKINDRFYNSILWGISIGVFAFLIHSFFDTNLYSLNLVTLFWVAIGVSQAIIKIFERRPA